MNSNILACIQHHLMPQKDENDKQLKTILQNNWKFIFIQIKVKIFHNGIMEFVFFLTLRVFEILQVACSHFKNPEKRQSNTKFQFPENPRNTPCYFLFSGHCTGSATSEQSVRNSDQSEGSTMCGLMEEPESPSHLLSPR